MLNPYQKNALEISLRQLEQVLRRARQWLRQPPENGRLTTYAALPEEVEAELEALIENMLAEIDLLAERFELRPRVEDLGRILNAELAVSWADLLDSHAPKLARYGAVDPDVSAALDPHLRRLARWCMQLGGIATRTPAPDPDGHRPELDA